MNLTSTHKPLIQNLWQGENALLTHALYALLGSAILVAGAHLKVPFYPVPVTMQTLAVLLIGLTYGARLGGATLLLYLGYGAVGLPVFAGGVGIATFVGPTGGYLIGFFFAAVLCGALAERGFDRTIFKSLIAVFAATCVIYMFGLAWLGTVIGWEKPVLKFGLYPFIPGDILKMLLAVGLIKLLWQAPPAKK